MYPKRYRRNNVPRYCSRKNTYRDRARDTAALRLVTRRILETIVGNIYDESDPQIEQDIIELDNGEWRVAGSVELERLEKELGFKLVYENEDDEDFDTLGGLAFSRMTAIPDDGQCGEVVTAGNLEITIESIIDHQSNGQR